MATDETKGSAYYSRFGRMLRDEEAKDREARSIAGMGAMMALPDGIGLGIAPAPARGTVMKVRPEEVARTEAGGLRFRRLTDPGASAIRQADAFDVMEEQTARRAKSQGKQHDPIFTPTQIEAGRNYGYTYERVQKGAVKGSDLELEISGGTGGSIMDRLLDDAARLRGMDAVLFGVTALKPTVLQPNEKRRIIPMIDLIQRVAVAGHTTGQVLTAYRWSEKKSKYRALILQALRDGLDSLYGL